MRITKKIGVFLLALLVAVSSVSVIPFATDGEAEEKCVLKTAFSGGEILPGERFTVTVFLEGTVRTESFGLDYSSAFDTTAFELVRAFWSEQITEQSSLYRAEDGYAVFMMKEEAEITGELFTLELKPIGGNCRENYEIKVLPSQRLEATAEGEVIPGAHIFDDGCDEICNLCEKAARRAKHSYDDPQDLTCNRCGTSRELPAYVHAVHQGDLVKVSVSLKNQVTARGLGLDFAPAYDHDAFEWVEGDWSATVRDHAVLAQTNPGSEAVFAFGEETVLSGLIYSFVLKVKDDAPLGSYDVLINARGESAAQILSTAVTVHQCKADGAMKWDGCKHWNLCQTYGCWERLNEADHVYGGENGRKCDVCGYEEGTFIPGDLDSDGKAGISDAIRLLYRVYFPELYPVSQDADYDRNGRTDSEDAVYLLYHVIFPNIYPL